MTSTKKPAGSSPVDSHLRPTRHITRRRLPRAAALILVTGLALGGGLLAQVYSQPEAALERQFSGASVERKTLYLTKDQHAWLAARLESKNVARVHTFYIATRQGRVVGYGIFDTHRVRTKDETLFVAINPDGTIRGVEVISFFEPEEYLAPARWLAIFSGKTWRDPLRAGNDLPAITGASLTTQSVSQSVRTAAFLYRIHFESRAGGPTS